MKGNGGTQSRSQSIDPFGQRRGSIPDADQEDRSSGNQNVAVPSPLSYFKIAHGIKPQPPVLWPSVLSALLIMQQILMSHGSSEC